MYRATLHKNLVIGDWNSDWFVIQSALCVITLSFPCGRREENERFKWRNNPPGCWRRVFSAATVLVSFHLFDSIQQQGCSALYEVPSTEDQSFNVLFKIWGGEKEGSV